MTITRRALLKVVTLGAVAAALAPSVTTVQAASKPTEIDLSHRCVTCGFQTPWKRSESSHARIVADMETMDRHMVRAHYKDQPIETVWRPHVAEEWVTVIVAGVPWEVPAHWGKA